MKTALVPLPPLEWGGLQVFAANIASDLNAAGWRWLTIVPPEATTVQQQLRAAGVDVISASLPRLRRSPIETIRSVLSMRDAVATVARIPGIDEVDLIQAVGAHHPHGLLLAKSLGKPLVWQLHSSILSAPVRKVVAPLISSQSDAVLTNGRRVAEAFWGNRKPSPNHFVFYAPVDEGRFAPNPASRAEARRALSLGPNDFLVGTVGNRVWQKNHELLVQAAAMLAGHYPTLRFCVLGAPAAAYAKAYTRRVEAPAAALNKEHPGYIQFIDPGPRVDAWVQALDLFVLTSHAEGVPIALFESMSAAKPVVSADVGSISEVILPGVTGSLFPKGDLSAFVRQVAAMHDRREDAQKMGQSGRDRIHETFSRTRVVEAHVKAYESALGAYSRRT